MKRETEIKVQRLTDTLTDLRGGIGIGFSGGVDSSYLVYSAERARPGEVTAFFFSSVFVSHRELEWATRMADEIGTRFCVIDWDPLGYADIIKNDTIRCYYCKFAIYNLLKRECERYGLDHLLDGTQADDLRKDRPGLKALGQLGVKTPLADSGLGKNEIRELSQVAGLSSWNRESRSCLATRIRHGIPVSTDLLGKVSAIEELLHRLGATTAKFSILDSRTARLFLTKAERGHVDPHMSEIRKLVFDLGFKGVEICQIA